MTSKKPNLVERAGLVQQKEGNVWNACVITPGWGTSGYYSADVLRESAAVIPSGTQALWDHPTDQEAQARPEGSLRNLAGVLTENARWDDHGWNGAGLYSSVKTFANFTPLLHEVADHIGLSLRAFGNTHFGEAQGESGPIIDEIVAVASVDFVTLPGRGGRVKAILESKRFTPPSKEKIVMPSTKANASVEELRAAHAQISEGIAAFEQEGKTTPEMRRQATDALRILERRLTRTPKAEHDMEIEAARKLLAVFESLGLSPKAARTAVMGRHLNGYSDLQIEAKLMERGDADDAKRFAEISNQELYGVFRRLGLSEAEATIAAKGRERG